MTSRSGAPPREGRGGSGLGRSTAIFAIWTASSRVIGLVREMVAAALFGTAGIAPFVIAFNIPNVLRSLVADSALSAALIPAYTRLLEEGKPREARRLVGAMVGLTTMVLGAITLLAIVTAPWVMPLFAAGLTPDQQDQTVWLSQLMFPIVLLLALTGIVAAVLQANGEFGATGFVPVLWNAVIIACMGIGAVILPPGRDRLTAYAVGILLGTLTQLLYLLPHLRGKGPFRFGRSSPHLRGVLILMVPVTLGLGLININAAVDNEVASFISGAAVGAVDKAFRLYILPQGVFSVAISTVLFPSIARMVARGDRDGVGDMVSAGIRQIFFMLLPASAFLMVLAVPVTRLLYAHGTWSANDTSLTSKALVTFTIGLVFNGASLLLIRAFFSLQDPWMPTKVAAGGVLINVVLDLVLYIPLGVAGIPLSTSAVSLFSFLALLYALRGRVGRIDTAWLLDGFLRCLAASGMLAVMSWATWRILDDLLGRSLPAQVVTVGAALALGTAGYISAARAFFIPELGQLAQLRRPLR
ncbi:MAG: murein biosynthesis integral membrane protein MurJ [Thermoleophilia bacterium]